MKVFVIIAFFVSFPSLAGSFYELKFQSITGEEINLSSFKGRNLLLVNTASHCGYTGQYEQLEVLQKDLKGKNVVVIGFPSDSFNQEYKSNKEVADFCKFKYGVTFPLSKISPVIGKNKNSIFRYLVENSNIGKGIEVAWNFEKFVVDKRGRVVGRFPSNVKPNDPRIVNLLLGKSRPQVR